MKVATAVVTAVFCLALIGGSIEHVSGQTRSKKPTPQPARKTESAVLPWIGRDDEISVGNTGQLYYNLKILQVIDENNAICQFGTGGHLAYWFVMPTKGMVDGQLYDMRGKVFKVTGTRSYSTAIGGSKTVFVFELGTVQASDLRAAAARTEAEAAARGHQEEAARQNRIEAAKWRNWTSASGNHRTEAKFVRLVSDVVTLEKKDGSLIEVRLEQLCPEDQQFIQQRKWTKPDEAGAKNGSTPSASPPVAATLPKDKPKQINEDPRSRWLNTTYNSTIYRVQGKQWAEMENTTQKVKWTLEERDRTPEYIELFNTTRKDTTRLFDKRMDVKEGDIWNWVSNGHWTTPPPPTTTPRTGH